MDWNRAGADLVRRFAGETRHMPRSKRAGMPNRLAGRDAGTLLDAMVGSRRMGMP